MIAKPLRPSGRLHRLIAAALICAIVIAAFAAVSLAAAEDEPILYNTTPVHDPVARLQERLDRGEAKFDYGDAHGYLESVLRDLRIPVSSQSLVFSKTSFQRNLISPHKPRALYFNDDTYIGWVRGGSVLEVASMDSRQGAVFYTLKQEKAGKPKFIRQIYDCLQCHESGMTRNVPGLIMRSVYPDDSGQPILTAGTFVTNDQSPLRQRWGGWYVTGTHGRQRHMGNATIDDEENADQTDFSDTGNVTNLAKLVKTTAYLTPNSDIVALMTFAHQVHAHNLMTQANYEVRIALRDAEVMNKALGEPLDHRSESTRHRIESACEPLVRAIFFSGEARLTDPLKGTSAFADEFPAAGPRDQHGRSLRDFDLSRRLFKYPCSYLIYSEQFDGLPPDGKEYVYRRMSDVLSGREQGKAFAHLSAEDRKAILEILLATKPGLLK